MKSFSIFISSPSDVRLEREETRRVIEQLGKEFAGRAAIGAYFWESAPLEAAKAPQASLREATECDIVVGILWKRMGTPLSGDRYRRADGSQYESGTAYELETSLVASRAHGKPSVIIYRNGRPVVLRAEPPEARKEDTEQYDRLTAFLDRHTRGADGTFTGAYKIYPSVEQFKQLLDEDLTQLIEKELDDGDGVRREPSWAESPFRGLEVFDLEHEAIFFGRTGAINSILERLNRQSAAQRPFVLVLGMSGSGKSSLVRAGVLPRLFRARAVGGIEMWQHAILKPSDGGGDPVAALAQALLAPTALPWLADGEVTAARLRDNLDETVGAMRQSLLQAGERERERQRETIRQYIDRLEKDHRTAEAEEVRAKLDELPTPKAGLVLVIDQMEELFDDQITPEQRKAFMTIVDRLVRKGVAHVLATLRSDFYGRCHELPGLEQLKAGDGQFDLPWPGKVETAQMIRQPARLAALRFETDAKSGQTLDERLLDDAAKFPENLPLLEFVLDALYQSHTPDRLLTHAAYDALGGLEGAIAKKANDVWTSLSAAAQRTANEVFGALVQISADEGARVRRKYAPRDTLRENPDRRAFVDAFVKARLFVAAGGEGESSVSLAHETLIEHFPPLKQWVDAHREQLRVRSRLAAAAALWDEKKRQADHLLRGSQLAEAKALKREGWIDLNKIEDAFIAASLRAQRNRRILVTTVACVAIAVLGFGVFAAVTARDARDTARAQDLTREADSARDRQPKDSVRLAREATTLRPVIGAPALRRALEAARELDVPASGAGQVRAVAFAKRSRVIAAGTWKGTIVRDLSSNGNPSILDPDDRVESVAFAPDDGIVLTAGAKGVRLWRDGNEILSLPAKPPVSAAFSPDGKSIAYTDDGRLRLWASDGSWGRDSLVEKPSPEGHVSRFAFAPNGSVSTRDTPLNDMAFSPDGEIVVEGLNDGTARLWRQNPASPQDRQVIAILKGHDRRVTDVAYSPGGRFLATASADGTAVIWEAATSEQVARLRGHRDAVLAVAFSADGSMLATGGEDGSVRLWNPGGDSHPMPHGESVNAAVFSRDGEFVLTASSDGKVRVWLHSSGELIAALLPPTSDDPDPLMDVDIDPQGRWVAAGSEGGGVAIWNAATCKLATELRAHTGVVTSVSFLRDGTLMTAGTDGRVRYWTPGDWREKKDQELSQDEPIAAAASSPVDDSVVATAGRKGTLRLWDLKTSRDARTLGGVKGQLLDVDFSDDGKLILAAGEDAHARIWDAASGAVQQTLSGTSEPSQPIRTARFRPGSSTQLATADEDGRVLFWNGESGEVVAELSSYRAAVMRAAFRPDGLALVTASADGRARVDPWSAFVPVDELLARSAQHPALPEPRRADVFACPPPSQS